MNQLLDTDALLLILQGADEARPIRSSIEQGANAVSVASFWEAAIKVSLGKLALPYDVERLPELCEENGFTVLEIGAREAVRVAALPWHHRDPFDRLLVAQCQVHRLPIVIRDPNLERYGIERIWGR